MTVDNFMLKQPLVVLMLLMCCLLIQPYCLSEEPPSKKATVSQIIPLEIATTRSAVYRGWRLLQHLQQWLQRLQRKDEAYFKRSITQKRLDVNYPDFDQMVAIQLPADVRSHLQSGYGVNDDLLVAMDEQLNALGHAMTLGRLPDQGFFDQIRYQADLHDVIQTKLISQGWASGEINQFNSKVNALKHKLRRVLSCETSLNDYSSIGDQYAELSADLEDNGHLLFRYFDLYRLREEKRVIKRLKAEACATCPSMSVAIDTLDKQMALVRLWRQLLDISSQDQRKLLLDDQVAEGLLSLTDAQKFFLLSHGGLPKLRQALGALTMKSGLTLKALIDSTHAPSTRPLSIISLVEPFELSDVLKGASVDNKRLLPEGRFFGEVSQVPILANVGDPSLEWYECSTRDRQMLTPEVLSLAVDGIQSAIDRGRQAYVHCKSGKSRSATAVITARTDYIVTALNAQKIELKPASLKMLFNSQYKQVSKARRVVWLNPCQRFVALDTLVKRQAARLGK